MSENQMSKNQMSKNQTVLNQMSETLTSKTGFGHFAFWAYVFYSFYFECYGLGNVDFGHFTFATLDNLRHLLGSKQFFKKEARQKFCAFSTGCRNVSL
jgi:hypothetical protein